ncbi:mannosyl-oligosaccharide 1,2-alpha-mannosidase [Malassezia caprae]|uniref:alpha-1,2-Mannosidase n=1 Tax=Malassezia caprae TaxID=1381934 RepID=A0AAF0E8H4_9BASI|nr:mannosyl-oligosaccharide 1,2-alpha-mannosidase [Malassezia caprae]
MLPAPAAPLGATPVSWLQRVNAQMERRAYSRPWLFMLLYSLTLLLIVRGVLFVAFYGSNDQAHIRVLDEYTAKLEFDAASNATFTPASFPAVVNAAAMWPNLTAVSSDPHRGELDEHTLAILRQPPPLVPPPPPTPLQSDWKTVLAPYTHGPWTPALNGSRTAPEDAMRPAAQPLEPDWRELPWSAWRPPIANLSAPGRPLPRVQYAFEDDRTYSGQRANRTRDAVLQERQQLVKNAFLHSWQSYKTYAWGADEVRPITKQAANDFNGWGATIVDALDTLLVMGLHDEYALAREHVHDIDFLVVCGERSAYGTADGRVPVFETAIRYLGGLLSAYDLTGDVLMRERAEELAQLLLPAFDTVTGVPVGRMRLQAPHERVPTRTRGRGESVILSEAASMLLEYTRLWQVTGNRTYWDRVQRVTDVLDTHFANQSELGTLIPTRIYMDPVVLAGKYTFGAQADSYYEYLIKEHQLLDGRLAQYARMYEEAMDSAMVHLFRDVGVVPHSPNLLLAAEVHANQPYAAKLEHLGCFAGAMMALGARLRPARPYDMNTARRLTETCYWAYNSSATGIGPEMILFFRPTDTDRFQIVTEADGTRRRGNASGFPLVGMRQLHSEYRNRPETIESVLYLWRTTGDPVWQERGWQMFASWMTYGLSNAGIAAVQNVNRVPTAQMDSMESFTLAETFKYYYLLFSPPSLVSLDDFVFTTEAHPLLLPQRGRWAAAGAVPSSFPRPSAPWAPLDRPRGGMTHQQKALLYDKVRRSSGILSKFSFLRTTAAAA